MLYFIGCWLIFHFIPCHIYSSHLLQDLHDASDELIVSDLVDSVKASSAELINTIELDVIDVEFVDQMERSI